MKTLVLAIAGVVAAGYPLCLLLWLTGILKVGGEGA